MRQLTNSNTEALLSDTGKPSFFSDLLLIKLRMCLKFRAEKGSVSDDQLKPWNRLRRSLEKASKASLESGSEQVILFEEDEADLLKDIMRSPPSLGIPHDDIEVLADAVKGMEEVDVEVTSKGPKAIKEEAS